MDKIRKIVSNLPPQKLYTLSIPFGLPMKKLLQPVSKQKNFEIKQMFEILQPQKQNYGKTLMEIFRTNIDKNSVSHGINMRDESTGWCIYFIYEIKAHTTKLSALFIHTANCLTLFKNV